MAERGKRKGKAKVNEADPKHLPLKTDINTNDQRCYQKFVGELRSKLLRIREKDVLCFLGDKDERLRHIHDASRATIGITSDPAARSQRQAFLELLGTVDQVKIAEMLIIEAITKMYKMPLVPTALMPMCISRHEIFIPYSKVPSLLGVNGDNLLLTEVQSGAWIEVNMSENPSFGKPWMRGVIIYGSDLQVANALNIISKLVPVEEVTPEDKTLKLF